MLLDNAFNVVKPDRGAQFGVYLVSHADPKTGIFNRTYKQIKEDLDISEMTISRYFKIVEDSGTVVRVGPGRWLVKAVIGESSACDGPDLYVTRGFIPKR